MKKWAVLFAIAGTLWMLAVVYTGSVFLATVSNYPGMFAARWIHRGIAPSSVLVWGFNLWLVLTSAIEWTAIGLAIRSVVQRLLH